MSSFISGVSYIKAWSIEYDRDGTEDAAANSVTARAIGYGLVIKALLDLKLQVTIQTAILIDRHVYPLLQKRCFLFFGAVLSRGLHLGDLFLFSALSRFEFAI